MICGADHRVGRGRGLTLGHILSGSLGEQSRAFHDREHLPLAGLPARRLDARHRVENRFAPGSVLLARPGGTAPQEARSGGQLRFITEECFEESFPLAAREFGRELPQVPFIQPLSAEPSQQLLASIDWAAALGIDRSIQSQVYGEGQPDSHDAERDPDPEQAGHREQEYEHAEGGERDGPVPPAEPPGELPGAGKEYALPRDAIDDEVRRGRLHEQRHDSERPARPTEEQQQDGGEDGERGEALHEPAAKYGLRRRIERMDETFEFRDLFFARAERAGGSDAEPGFERADHVVHALEAIVGALGEHALDHGREFGGNASHDPFRRHDRFVSLLRHEFDGGGAVERRAARNHHVQRAAERIDIGPAIDRGGIAALLRRHVRRRTQSDPGPRQVRGNRVQPTARCGECVVFPRKRRRLHETEIGHLHQTLMVQ